MTIDSFTLLVRYIIVPISDYEIPSFLLNWLNFMHK